MQAAEELMDEAREQTGLDDFGEEGFREGLDRLVWSLREEAELTPVGEMAAHHIVTTHLAQRLQVEDWYRRHPEIDDEQIVAPLIGLGLPRTGSTALSFLLAQDPHARSLLTWQATEPCPPPSTVTGHDPRIDRAVAAHEMQAQMAPRGQALLPTSPTGPMECQPLMALSFRSHYFQAVAYVPSYASWLVHDADLRSTYAYERRALKLLQWGSPTRPWRLKCPSHLLWMDALDSAFPDARFVWTHRDPTEVMVSVADVYMEMATQFGAEPRPRWYGEVNIEHWSLGMERALAFRDAGNEDRFYDIDFRTMQADPLGEIHRLYEWLGEPVTPEFDDGMQRWWRENSERRTENVHPDPAEFGIDLEQVRPLFSDYAERAADWTRG
ncbi:MAG TPA: sulfotransferase [Acidimicrobiales bacterium]